ncbi:MAG: hypothetical protein AB7K86_17650 [Rhodospirillales bacterium]
MWDAGGRDNGIAYADVTRLNVYTAPLGVAGLPLRRCVVRSRRGGRIVLQGTHYVRLGVTEDRRDAYGPFVDTLVRRAAAANPELAVIVGQSWAMWLVWLAILAGIVAVSVLSVVALIDGDFPWQAAIFVALVLGFAPTAWRIVRRDRPRRVAAGDFTAAMLD